jgi:Flp pilus assembly protein TadG
MVELALCFMGFLLLTFGCMDFGWGIYAYNFCSFAAQDAARWASVRGSSSVLTGAPATKDSITAFVKSQAVGLDPSLLTVTTTWMNGPTWTSTCSTDTPPTCSSTPTGYNIAGDYLLVTVSYTIKPLSGLAIKQDLLVSSTARYVISN